MNKRKIFLILSLLPGLFLTSCGESASQDKGFISPLVTSKLNYRFNYVQNSGADGIQASMDSEHPELISADDTFTFISYIWGAVDFEGYFNLSDGLVTMEDSIRDDITTSFGRGYPVVGLGDECFSSASKATVAAIKGIKLGKNITSIGASCFSGLTELTDLNLSDLTELDYIGDGAFDNVPWYTSQVEGNTNSLLTFGNVVLDYSGTGSTVIIPEGVTSIYQDAFKGHGEITSIKLPSTLKTIGKDAFNGTGLVSVTIPDSVTSIGDGAFADCGSLVSADMSYSELGEGALAGDSNLISLTYSGGETISSLGGEAGLERLTSVKIIGDEIVKDGLAGLPNLTNVDLSDSVKIIQPGAFSSDERIETISNYEGVEFIYDNSLADSAWYASQADGAIYLGNNLLAVKNTDKDISQIKSTITGISKEGFKGYTGAFSLPSTVKYLGEKSLFGCKGLASADLPNAIYVGKNCLAYCTALTSVKLADNCMISENFLANDEAITSLAIPFASADNGLEYILGDADISDTLESYTFLAGDDAKTVPDKMFYGYKSLASVTFSDTIKSIGVKAFAYCSSLTQVDFPVNIQTIDVLAFASCTALTKVNFNVSAGKNTEGRLTFSGVRSIKTLAFLNCSELSESTINGCQATEGMFMIPESIRDIRGNILQGTIVSTIQMRVIDYYLDGVSSQNDIATDQEYIIMSKQWNADPTRGTDDYGNALKIPYTVLIIDSADYQ